MPIQQCPHLLQQGLLECVPLLQLLLPELHSVMLRHRLQDGEVLPLAGLLLQVLLPLALLHHLLPLGAREGGIVV